MALMMPLDARSNASLSAIGSCNSSKLLPTFSPAFHDDGKATKHASNLPLCIITTSSSITIPNCFTSSHSVNN